MSIYYEQYVKDKRAIRILKQTMLSISLLLLLFIALFVIFAFIITFWLLVPAGVLLVIMAIFANFAHLLTKDFMYMLKDDELIIKKAFAEKYHEVNRINLSSIIGVQRGILSGAVSYTPLKDGITIATNNKKYAISPDDYLLALISKDKEIL
ncbi:MAG: hypothetical protein EOM87_05795 [Clostridia bacterium]|nr:hypothetical protein [Clostridia bacterium]